MKMEQFIKESGRMEKEMVMESWLYINKVNQNGSSMKLISGSLRMISIKVKSNFFW